MEQGSLSFKGLLQPIERRRLPSPQSSSVIRCHEIWSDAWLDLAAVSKMKSFMKWASLFFLAVFIFEPTTSKSAKGEAQRCKSGKPEIPAGAQEECRNLSHGQKVVTRWTVCSHVNEWEGTFLFFFFFTRKGIQMEACLSADWHGHLHRDVRGSLLGKKT